MMKVKLYLSDDDIRRRVANLKNAQIQDAKLVSQGQHPWHLDLELSFIIQEEADAGRLPRSLVPASLTQIRRTCKNEIKAAKQQGRKTRYYERASVSEYFRLSAWKQDRQLFDGGAWPAYVYGKLVETVTIKR